MDALCPFAFQVAGQCAVLVIKFALYVDVTNITPYFLFAVGHFLMTKCKYIINMAPFTVQALSYAVGFISRHLYY